MKRRRIADWDDDELLARTRRDEAWWRGPNEYGEETGAACTISTAIPHINPPRQTATGLRPGVVNRH